MSCLICYDSFDDEPLPSELPDTSQSKVQPREFSVTTCGHLFHTECFNKWNELHKGSRRCAMCCQQCVGLIKLYQNFTNPTKSSSSKKPNKPDKAEIIKEEQSILAEALKRVEELEDEILILKARLISLE